ncbi:uracil-DNA glycosylase [Marinicauda algicola]|uniref:Type-5 uracil-DNA glycosylase n=1 Tax=Marinicauda algicola TaxID=2029849 RepID=A0A4S2GWQ5_9PROT|nr:uracil-DNA glycosylase [Marinicauda algicola]TGY87453.1 uracil-DNA glycosylase [Marinicauda algicola]
MSRKDAGDFPPEPPFDCPRCPRLVEYRKENARKEPHWHNAPVHSFGDTGARLLIVGLAPGRTGANRTARPFTGDWAGDLLYPTLQKFGFARGTFDKDGDDDLQLVEAMITNAVRCVPPENKPTGEECNRCRPFLTARIEDLPQLEIILALGGIAHTNTLRALGVKASARKFEHNAWHDLEGPDGRAFRLVNSYHCSRYNTNTGRLTTEMFEEVFAGVRGALSG